MAAIYNTVAVADGQDTTTLRTLNERGISYAVSRSKHQTLKSIMGRQSKREIDLMFAEKDHDAMEWVEKRRIKKVTRTERNGKKWTKKTKRFNFRFPQQTRLSGRSGHDNIADVGNARYTKSLTWSRAIIWAVPSWVVISAAIFLINFFVENGVQLFDLLLAIIAVYPLSAIIIKATADDWAKLKSAYGAHDDENRTR